MVKKSNRYGIADEDLLCDEKVEATFPPGSDTLLDSYSSAAPFIEDEERRIAQQIESFVLRRIESRKAAYIEVLTEFNAKDEKLAKSKKVTDGTFSTEKKRFPKFLDFLETLSKEDSGIKVVSKDEEIACRFSDVAGTSFEGTEKLVNASASQSTGNFNLTKLDASVSKFAPPNFSTPNDSTPRPQVSLFQNVSQTPMTPKKSGHPTLTRTDTIAARLPLAPTVFVNQKVGLFGETSAVPSVAKEPTLATPLFHSLQTIGQLPPSATFNGFGFSGMKTSLFAKAKPIEEETPVTSEVQEERSNKPKEVVSSSSPAPSENKENLSRTQSASSRIHQLWMNRMPFDDFLPMDQTVEASVTEFDKRSKDVLRSLAKRSIREKIACWTRKNANSEVIRSAVNYFDDLLTGKTVYGFDGKMLNFNGDEPGTKFSMTWIVNCYVNVVQRDNLLLECAATVLLSMMNKIPIFKSVVYTILFATSPLLCINQDECLKQISGIKTEDNNLSEAVNSWCNKQSAVVSLFVFLHCPKTRKDAVLSDANFDLTSRLWSILAAAASEESPFASAFTAEVLKLAGAHLSRAYRQQFQKLVAFISKRALPKWKEEASSICGLSRMAVGHYLVILDMALKEFSSS